MRHVMGLALAVAMAVVLFVAGSWGYLKLLASPARSGVLPAGRGLGSCTTTRSSRGSPRCSSWACWPGS